MGGNPTCVPPNFNDSMKVIWEELWESMPQSGKVSITVNKLLQQYKERCRTERKRKLDDESPLALLPVSFAQAKDWLMKQQRAQSEAVEAGAVNEEAREIISDLSHLLEERPPSVLHLLEQPPLSAFCAENSNKKLILKKVSAPHSVVASLQPITYCVCSF